MKGTADRVFQGVDNRHGIIRESQSCQRRGERHPFASGKVVRFENGLDQMPTNQLDRAFGKTITNRLFAVVGERFVGGNIQFVEMNWEDM